MSVSGEILVVVLLIAANGILAMAEMAIVSARKARLRHSANEGDLGAQAALELATAPGPFLSTIQIGITLVSLLTGAFSGATLADSLAQGLSGLAVPEPYCKPLALATVVLAIGYFSLVLGELVPKRLALHNAEKIAARLAPSMTRLAWLAYPAVKLLNVSTETVFRLLRIRPPAEPPVTEEEIKVMVEQAAQAGVVEEAEQAMVEKVFRLGDRRVDELMTPRPKIVWLDLDAPPQENWQEMASSSHSYFPVYQDRQDNLLGLASVKTLWARLATGQPMELKDLLLKPLLVPESMTALRLVEMFKRFQTHIALAVDEYGSIQGLITIIDVLEAVVGDIPSLEQQEEAQVVEREDGSWLVDGTLSIEELKTLLRVALLPGEEKGGFQTLGGLIMARMGRIPAAGDHFEWERFRFEVMDMDGPRVDKVLIAPQPAPPPAAPPPS